MGRLAGAVIARDHHAAVAREARQDGQGGLPVEKIIRVEVGDVLLRLREGRHFQIRIDPEDLTHGHFHVRGKGCCFGVCLHGGLSVGIAASVKGMGWNFL
jgi:hypothetical protein